MSKTLYAKLQGNYISNCCGAYVLGGFAVVGNTPESRKEMYKQVRLHGPEWGLVFDSEEPTNEIDTKLTEHCRCTLHMNCSSQIEMNRRVEYTNGEVLIIANLSKAETSQEFHDYFNTSTIWKKVNTWTNFKTHNVIHQYHYVMSVV